MAFVVEKSEDVTIDLPKEIDGFYVLSPCVWKEGDACHALMRVANPSDIPSEKVSRIHYGRGLSPSHFVLDAQATVAPGPQADDADGCEDPTVAKVRECYSVYYTGWNEPKKTGHLLLATGNDVHHLRKQGRAFTDVSRHRNAKEATIVCAADNTWRLFFEFAEDDRSKIGMASSPQVDGPWKFEKTCFDARKDLWDCWHLSTGPISTADPDRPVMFYNGADRDARWRIGWAEFDSCFTKTVRRCEEPLITPPPEPKNPEDTDIAFAASTIEDGKTIRLYYTIADRLIRCALIVKR